MTFISDIGAVRRGSDEIELSIEGDARRYVFAELRQREQVVDALAKLLSTHGTCIVLFLFIWNLNLNLFYFSSSCGW